MMAWWTLVVFVALRRGARAWFLGRERGGAMRPTVLQQLRNSGGGVNDEDDPVDHLLMRADDDEEGDVLVASSRKEEASWEECETWEKVLKEADRRVSAMRNSFDSYLRIAHATDDDVELACGALYRIAELVVEDGAEEALKDRRLAQLLEVVECRASHVSLASACRCAWALSVFGSRGPDNLLASLETTCARQITDAKSAAVACRAFACASAEFGPPVGIELRDSVARLLEGEVSFERIGDLADVATALAFAYCPEADDEPHVVDPKVDGLVAKLMTPKSFSARPDGHQEDYDEALATAAGALAKLQFCATTTQSVDSEAADALAAATANRREAVAANPRATANLAWALVRCGKSDEARRLLQVFLDRISLLEKDESVSWQKVITKPEDSTRLAWSLAACLPRSEDARRACRSIVAECTASGGVEDELLSWSQRSRLVWAAAILETDHDDEAYDRPPFWIRPTDSTSDATATDAFATALGAALASLQLSPVDEEDAAAGRPTLGCACRAAWAAAVLGAPSDALFSMAEAAAASKTTSKTRDDAEDVAKTLCAWQRRARKQQQRSSWSSSSTPTAVVPRRLARLAIDLLDDESDDVLTTSVAGCAARLCGTSAASKLATPDRFRRLVASGKPKVAVDLAAAAGSSSNLVSIDQLRNGAVDVSKLAASDAAALLRTLACSSLAAHAPFLEPLAVDLILADKNDTALSADLVCGLCKACAALAARGVVLASLANALHDALDLRTNRTRPTKMDLLQLSLARGALNAVQPRESLRRKHRAKPRLFKHVLNSLMRSVVQQLSMNDETATEAEAVVSFDTDDDDQGASNVESQSGAVDEETPADDVVAEAGQLDGGKEKEVSTSADVAQTTTHEKEKGAAVGADENET